MFSFGFVFNFADSDFVANFLEQVVRCPSEDERCREREDESRHLVPFDEVSRILSMTTPIIDPTA